MGVGIPFQDARNFSPKPRMFRKPDDAEGLGFSPTCLQVSSYLAQFAEDQNLQDQHEHEY